MKKVCHITTVHPAFDTRIFHKEAKALLGVGYNVILVAQHDKNETIDGIRIISLSKPKNRLERMLKLSQKAYKLALEQKADIYHFHDPELLPWMIKLRKKTRAKVIYDVHEDVPQQILSKGWVPKFFRGVLARVFNIYEKNRAAKLDFIITAWPKIKENFQRKGINNIETIFNYPVLEYFKSKNNGKYEMNNTGKRKIIYVGGLTKIRGIKEIVKSLNYLKDKNIKLVLVGRFSEKSLEKELQEMSEWQRVDFKGWLSQKRAYSQMQNSCLGLVCFLPAPNHIYAIPNKIFEYMAAGLPVIASNFPLWKEIVEGNNCGICVDPSKPDKIAEAIEYLTEHPDEAKRMGENGRKAVLGKYNWENESKKLLKIYEKLTG